MLVGAHIPPEQEPALTGEATVPALPEGSGPAAQAMAGALGCLRAGDPRGADTALEAAETAVQRSRLAALEAGNGGTARAAALGRVLERIGEARALLSLRVRDRAITAILQGLHTVAPLEPV